MCVCVCVCYLLKHWEVYVVTSFKPHTLNSDKIYIYIYIYISSYILLPSVAYIFNLWKKYTQKSDYIYIYIYIQTTFKMILLNGGFSGSYDSLTIFSTDYLKRQASRLCNLVRHKEERPPTISWKENREPVHKRKKKIDMSSCVSTA